jgi:putative transposase
MRMSQSTVDKLIHVLGDLEDGLTVRGACRRHHLSTHTFYRWKKTMSGKSPMERLRFLECENRRLKHRMAELSLDYHALRSALVNEPGREC